MRGFISNPSPVLKNNQPKPEVLFKEELSAQKGVEDNDRQKADQAQICATCKPEKGAMAPFSI